LRVSVFTYKRKRAACYIRAVKRLKGVSVGVRARLMWLSLGVAVPLALVGALVLWGLWRESRRQIDASIESQTQLAAVAFERWMEGQRNPLRTLAGQAAIPAPTASTALAKNFALVISNRPHWLDLHLLDARGNTLLAQPPQSPALPQGTVTDAFAKLNRRDSWAITTDWTRSAERPVIVISAPVEGGGAIIARADAEAIGELFRDINLAPGSVIAVFDSRQRILYRSPTFESYVGADVSNTSLFASLDERRRAVVEQISPYDGVRRIYGLAHAGDTDCIVMIGTPTSILLEPAQAQFTRYAFFSLLALASALVAAFLLARGVIRPVQKLEQAARDLGAGNLAARAPARSLDEFGRLGLSFNQMAMQIQEREARLTELDRLKSEFVSSVSHELRTPLTTIKTLTRLLLRARHTEAEKREYLETIAVECDRQIELVVNLLDLSRIEAGAFNLSRAPVDAGEVLRSCATALRHATEAKHQILRLNLDDDLPFVEADTGALRRVIGGLVENAVKYSSEGGTITLRAMLDAGDSDVLAISVTDTGRGIPEEDLPHVFDKFYRSHSALDASGIGLGLYLARTMVEHMNGSLTVESRVGAGSTFTIRLLVWKGEIDKDMQQAGVDTRLSHIAEKQHA